jgi:hypothetical protein
MKKFILLGGIATLLSFHSPVDSISKKERKLATSHLNATKNEVVKSVKGLSDAQLNFRSAPDKWSVKECVYHIAMSESMIWQMVEGIIKSPVNPEKRPDIKMTDDQVIAGVTSRSTKVKTSEPFEPKNAKWTSINEALESFKEERTRLINYVKSTSEDLRNHVAPQTPLGPLDSYQMILFLSSHTDRHADQIKEIKRDPNFPKK